LQLESLITFEYEGKQLLGVHHQVEDQSAPLVLFLHGIPGDRVDARRLPVRMARRLQSEGISSIRVDFIGSGVSDGELYHLSQLSLIDQSLSLLRQIRNIFLFSGSIMLVGFSEAAKIAMNVLSSEDINGICLWNGIVMKEEHTTKKLSRFYRKDGQLVFQTGYGVWLNKNIISEPEPEKLINLSTMKNDIYGIFGEEDTLTTNSRKFLKENGVYISVIPQADHLFTRVEWEEKLMELTADWIKQRFEVE
jgi:dienelactone hydrolase